MGIRNTVALDGAEEVDAERHAWATVKLYIFVRAVDLPYTNGVPLVVPRKNIASHNVCSLT